MPTSPAHLRRSVELLLKRHALVAALLLATTAACGGDEEAFQIDEETADITAVPQSWVKRQSIGNCWLYATASWAESLNKTYSATSKLNVSESYWTYFHWFEGITSDDLEKGEIGTGGSWDVAIALISRYGVVEEAKFIPTESELEMSGRQKAALTAMNASLKTGALKTPAARRNRALVRAELDKAWQLDARMIAQLDKVFGKTISQNLTTKSGTRYKAVTTGTDIKRASTVKVKYSMGPTKAPVTKTLADAISQWKEVSYWASSYGNSKRTFEKRIQRALHRNQPVIMSWFVDFNALDSQGRFMAPPASPGSQGGHMTVLHDYEIDNVPGYGTLKAGVNETRAAALEAALSDAATIKFIRTKNSWGALREDRAFSLPGYHDLYAKYLYGPVKRCPDETNKTNCVNYTPLQDVVLPPGY